MLKFIADAAARQQQAVEEEPSWYWQPWRPKSRAAENASWVRRDVGDFAGVILTASERIVHQRALRDMEDAGLVEGDGKHVRITDLGREELAK
jgi:hypothetical protein